MVFSKQEAAEYDGWYESILGAFVDQVETELAFDLFRPQKAEKVLDIGCGTGNFSLKLAQKGCLVVGIDVSEPMLDKAREKAEKAELEINFAKQDAANLEFPAESFDGVFSITAFEFMADYKKTFSEMMRVLKPGGKLLIGTIRRDSDWGRLYQQMAEKEDSVFRYAQFKTPEEVNKLAPGNLVESRECLFISPDTSPEKITREEEVRLNGKKKGGFFCTLWKKPL